MTQDYWRPIKGYEHLLVSRTGKVWTTLYNREIGQFVTNRGYLSIKLCKDKTVKNVGVHRLVAEAFIPNPDNLPQVDHIDGNKRNNNVENLQWISPSDNTKKACKGVIRRAKPIVCIETGKVYQTIKEANRELHIPEAVISAIIRGEFPAYHGLSFAYAKQAGVEIPQGYITLKEYAAKNNVPATTVKSRVFNGFLPCIKLGEGNARMILIKENEPWITLKKGRKSTQ